MGCDIHLHTEVKINGEWHHYSAPHVDRNYCLFSKMAGVRNADKEVEPLALPRGLPKDISAVTRFDNDKWEGDAHSHSYLTAPEIYELVLWVADLKLTPLRRGPFWESDQFGYLFGNDFSGFTKYPEDRPVGLEDVRFVFWFDN